jgi:succinoglycan biosynthesis transport protein ExoP
MKKLRGNSPSDNGFGAIEPFYSSDIEEAADGYYGALGNDDEKQIFRTFLATLRKHWLLIVLINILITSAVIVYVAQKPDYYQAVIRIQVNSEFNPAAGLNSERGGSIIVGSANDPAYFSTQLQILEGEGLLRRVAKNIDLENNPAFFNPQGKNRPTVWQNVKRLFGFYQPPAKDEDRAGSLLKKNQLSVEPGSASDADKDIERLAPYVSVIKNNLSVNPVFDSRMKGGETRLIEVAYTHGDPEIAAKVVNSIGDTYVLLNLENKIKTNTSAGDFLQKRVAELQSLIRQGEERLINYSKSNQIVSLNEGQNTVVQRLADLNQQLGQAENARIAAQTAYQAAQQNKMRDATVQSQDAQVMSLESRLGELRQKLAQLKTEYTDEWYEVRDTKTQIAAIEEQLKTLRKRAADIQTATLEERLNEAIARERELRNSFEKQRAEVLRQNEASINYKIIQQEIETNKVLLNDLLQRLRENDVILNGTPNNVLVADRALPPDSPVGPQRAKDIGLAFIMSLAFGIGLAFVIDWFNDSVQHSEDLESLFGLPVLAKIPAAPMLLSRKLLPPRLRRRRKIIKNYNLKAFDKTEFQESYLQLSTQLLLSTAGGHPKTILVTSGEEGEGKTLTALNLAKSLALTGKKVLLIDADLRCPKIHTLVGKNNFQGLTTLLTASNAGDELIDQCVQKTEIENLEILTSGERTVNPANLLTSEEMRRLLVKLSERYSHIIIDSPPVLYFADSLIISTMTDVSIIVVRDNHSSKEAIMQTRKTLHTVGANIIGIVVNGVPLRWSAYYKYRDYEAGEELPQLEGEQAILKLN